MKSEIQTTLFAAEGQFNKIELSLSLISSQLSDTDINRWEDREQVTGSGANSTPTWVDLIEHCL